MLRHALKLSTAYVNVRDLQKAQNTGMVLSQDYFS